mmetsp:Transcript_24670/g.72159  ORF Transcript_24670/g.72159 Transcript_24670/m.72159 type:complete len:223 (-) Transcript_24670:1039-1707(-)
MPSSDSIPLHFEVGKRLTEETMSQNLRGMEYAVRGSVVIAADRINHDLTDPDSETKHPYDHIIYTNIGNPQGVGQNPLTWPRQVLSLCDLPDECGVDHPKASEMFPADAVERAREIKKALGGSTGAYTHSQGPLAFRKDITAFIEKRDGGVKADPQNIFMTNGASSAIGMVLTALIADSSCGVMIPVPQVCRLHSDLINFSMLTLIKRAAPWTDTLIIPLHS